jgi:putative acetyltransferase
MEIHPVQASDELDVVQTLFHEYWTSFGFTPCFQSFETEVANLPGDYAPPGGRLAIAFADGEAAGCIALRRFDTVRAEAKRLYVRSAFRGRGVGRSLLDWVIAEARAAGYNEIVCDTMPVMFEALNMYASSGFERTGPYSDHATAGAIYLRLKLS